MGSRLVLEVLVEWAPPSAATVVGRLRCGQHDSHFTGWLDLLSQLEELIEREREAPRTAT